MDNNSTIAPQRREYSKVVSHWEESDEKAIGIIYLAIFHGIRHENYQEEHVLRDIELP